MYHISSAMKAFYEDLQNQNLADRVLSMTYSEFGRRAASNASYGTDHGNAAPMLVFGTCLNPGIYGENPDLSNLQNNNIPMQHDYRQVFSSVVKDWFGATSAAIAEVISSKTVLTIRSTSRWNRCGLSSAIFWINSERIIAGSQVVNCSRLSCLDVQAV